MPKNTFFNLPKEKRERIIKTAIEEFAQAPYQDISINHLIKCLDIPTGSFYQYFEDKKDLYFHILCYYMDGLLEESGKSGKKLDLFDEGKNRIGTAIFDETRNRLQNYQAIFVDNFNKAPQEIKRDWSFENIIGGKYMALYDYSIFDSEEVDPAVREAKHLMLGLAMAVPNVLQRFCSRCQNNEEYHRLYRLCIDVLQTGITTFHSKDM